MNILFLTSHLNTGGITSYLFLLSSALIRRGHHITVVAADGDMRERFESIGVLCVLKNIRVKNECHPRIYYHLPHLCSLIKTRHINIIHAQTRVTQVMGTIASWITKIPLVTTAHGFFKPRFFRKLWGCWGKTAIAISTAVAQHLENDFHLPPTQCALVFNGIDISKFSPVDAIQKKECRSYWGITAEHVVGCIARLSDVKGLDILITSFKSVLVKYPQALLFIVGDGPEYKKLHHLTENLNLQSHVRFEKTVGKTADILPVFDVIAAPSRMEGLGLSVMEAMASSLPVVASRVGGLMDLITDRENGLLVDSHNSHQLALAIIALLDQPHLAENLGKKARHTIMTKFSLDQMVEGTLKVYEKNISC